MSLPLGDKPLRAGVGESEIRAGPAIIVKLFSQGIAGALELA
ncbi:hypothetical protein N9Z13_00220 [Luminiphilus sp.]|nr:hypothetical protein [Luminiphilus sp.]MDB2615318.1 hypothetical protein [Luminiphilus sp.]MDB3923099.1 hypothetical protein [Luminiphilus sp.]